jgi:hypothetical protein
VNVISVSFLIIVVRGWPVRRWRRSGNLSLLAPAPMVGPCRGSVPSMPYIAGLQRIGRGIIRQTVYELDLCVRVIVSGSIPAGHRAFEICRTTAEIVLKSDPLFC